MLTVIDHFTKEAHFVALPKPPSVLETTQLLTDHVFHDIKLDMVSNRGPQFLYQVWREFCSALNAKVSLFCGFHPQTNGQANRANQELLCCLF